MRVIAMVAVLNPALVARVGPPLFCGALAAVGFSAVAIRGRADAPVKSPVGFRNPFGFFSVIAMALSMGIIMLIGRIFSEQFGASGAVATAAITGLFDVDAMAISMTRLAPRILTFDNAANAVLVGVASATLGKLAIGVLIGRGRFAIAVGGMSILIVVVGALALHAITALGYP
jgi:uncharacterized membrane protein (DUF4010 family)